MKTITEISQLDGRVYVHLATQELALQFLRQAEEEGFTFRDGAKPTTRGATEVMAVNSDHTINYVGAAGHIAYQSGAKTIGQKLLIRVEFGLFMDAIAMSV